MLRVRVIPVLLLREASLVKTEKFGSFQYIGDPCNTVRIFNELEVDELAFLDISASKNGTGPDFELLSDIATECFMPLSYGGGISTFEQAKRVFDIGFEKVAVNSHTHEAPQLIEEIAQVYGGQAVIASIDVRRSLLGPRIYTHGGERRQSPDPVEWAVEMERRGAGEILLTSIDREGTWEGYDLELIRSVAEAVSIPVIANGGAASVADFGAAVSNGASSVAAGAMFVFQKKGFGVLVNFPEREELENALGMSEKAAERT